MNILNIDLRNRMPDMVDAYTEVFGTEYKDIIEQRVNKIVFVMYNNIDGVKDYCDFLEKHGQNGLADNQRSEEYERHLQEIESYKKYIADEFKRKIIMQVNRQKNTLYKKVEEFIPDDIRAFLDERYSSEEEKNKALLSIEFLGMKTLAEYFSQEDEAKLNDPSVSENGKNLIYGNRVGYFRQMGVMLDKKGYEFNDMREFYEYCVQHENVKKLMLPAEFASQITRQRIKVYEEAQRDFIYSSEDFIKLFEIFKSVEYLYMQIKDNTLCSCGIFNAQGFARMIMYTVREGDAGCLDYTFLHEMCHALESKELEGNYWRTGFDVFDNNVSTNPYNSKERKYERLNETITDIFTIEAREILHKKGIYLIEPKEIVVENVNNCNTHGIVKHLLSTFMEKYRKPIVRARVLGDMKGLYDIIGEENFEELNDAVNKVDSLVTMSGLAERLEANQQNDPIVAEYNKQLERLEQIYTNMEEHRQNGDMADNLLSSAVATTEEQTRLGQIYDGFANLTNTLERNGQNNLEESRS